MKTRSLMWIGLSAFGLTGAGIISAPGMIAVAASADNAKAAASDAGKARKALAKRDAARAVQFAEAAVGYSPQIAEYRVLLGQAYLLSGRFVSARQAFSDALTLNPSDGRAALNLALTEIAAGDWSGARNTLEVHANTIPAGDRGLAFALAGDPVKAIEILEPAARAADATAKTRQNLALALALAGRWEESKSVAAVDVPPDQLNARMLEWVAFARPTNAYDQVASLLGVRAIEDAGLPQRLALVAPAPGTGLAAADVPAAPVAEAPAADAVDSYMPGVPANADQLVAESGYDAGPAAESDTVVESSPVMAQVAGTGPQVVFGPREEIVQAIPAYYREAPRQSVAAAPAKRRAPAVAARGSYYVQLGAYSSVGVARESWNRLTSRVPAVGRYQPQSARVTTKAGNFYRVSVGGFARADADALCRQVRAKGSICFVRTGAGDQLASWAKGGATQLASR
ncbi:tetratricopeptide repeat protein [Sphingomonas canadensis]|uniref:Tetratricopeptide repeat protein n=1 Tax=Sphingomonas canadensis TaxID=1219257 RepID=A0ABW3H8Q1_9SPHN|nr:tetratricopeptide repeat protein [Sphingomonas canadensis]MCW3835502.1 SPOR domain-containing protein [Sphingomonas canadensis]